MTKTAGVTGTGQSKKNAKALFQATVALARMQRKMGSIHPASRQQKIPASFAQQSIWLVQQLTQESTKYNLSITQCYQGSLSLVALQQAFAALLQRHEILRTRLVFEDNQLLQEIHSYADFVLPIVDARTLTSKDLQLQMKEEATSSFAAQDIGLFRVKAFKESREKHHIVVTVHHSVFDGWSLQIMMRELNVLYLQFTKEQTLTAQQLSSKKTASEHLIAAPSLPALSIQYADYAIWQRQQLALGNYTPLLAYWEAQLDNAPLLTSFAADRQNLASGGGFIGYTFPHRLQQRMTIFAEQYHVTPYVVLLSTFKTLLYRYTGATDLVVGCAFANRNQAELDNMIGLFVNTLPLRTHLRGDMTFASLLDMANQVVLGGHQHRELPFEVLLKTLQLPRSKAGLPLIQVVVNYLNYPSQDWQVPGLTLSTENIPMDSAKYHLTLTIAHTSQGMQCWAEYDKGRFLDSTIQALLEQFSHILTQVIENPLLPLEQIPLAIEKKPVLVHKAILDTNVSSSFSGLSGTYLPNKSLVDIFEDQVDQSVNSVALLSGTDSISYATLDRRANKLAHYLLSQGITEETLVGVALERSPQYIEVILATLKCGATFIPVDTTSVYMINTIKAAGIKCFISATQYAHLLADDESSLLLLDTAQAQIEKQSPLRLATHVSAESMACVMFTSGSTGSPKGVCLSHKGITRLVKGVNYAELNAQQTFLQLASLSFDASLFEIWGALLNGAKLVLAGHSKWSLSEITTLIQQTKVTTLWLTAGLFEVFMDRSPQAFKHIEQLLVGGDVVSVLHARKFLEQSVYNNSIGSENSDTEHSSFNKPAKFINCYGPTENTTFSSYFEITIASLDRYQSIPIGLPVSQTQIYVLDNNMQSVPTGVIGEGYLGGDGLMLGYLGDPNLSAKKITYYSFEDENTKINIPVYKTGDLIRWHQDGHLEFVGRVDNQVKIRGFRIEPIETENAIKKFSAVENCLVGSQKNLHNHNVLIGYVVLKSGTEDTQDILEQLRMYLGTLLPSYLIPKKLLPIKMMPLTANGKIDKKQLFSAYLPSALFYKEPLYATKQAPKDAIETKLLAIFESVLEIESVELDDDFFILGGDSLSSLSLLLEVEKAFSVRLPLSIVFERPNIKSMAHYLRNLQQSDRANIRSPDLVNGVVEVHRGHSTTPLFLVPGGHGGTAEMTLYARAISLMSDEHSVYGFIGIDDVLPDQAEINTCHKALSDVQSIAHRYIKRMKQIQATGPYAIAGECVGGVIAFEMAYQLRAQNETVKLLLLIDTWYPTLRVALRYRLYNKPMTLIREYKRALHAGGKVLRAANQQHLANKPKNWNLKQTIGFLYDYPSAMARTILDIIVAVTRALRAGGKVLKTANQQHLANKPKNWNLKQTIGFIYNYPRAMARTILAIIIAVTRALHAGGKVLRTANKQHLSNWNLKQTIEFLYNYPRAMAPTVLEITMAVTRVGRAVKGGEQQFISEQHYISAAMAYRPPAYSGKIQLLVCENNKKLGIDHGWNTHCTGELKVDSVPGDHENYFIISAAKISQYLAAYLKR